MADMTKHRMSLCNVIKGKQPRPYKLLVYGTEGVGKSTFAAMAPNPIFLCPEDGTAHLDVARFPGITKWDEMFVALAELETAQHEFKTLVIDTLDWLEPLVWESVAKDAGKGSIEEIAYGKGYTLAVDKWRQLAAGLDRLVSTRKMHVILLAHSHVRRHDDPQVGVYDRFSLKLHASAGAVMKEWCDAVLFARHEAFAVKKDKSNKARGMSTGNRILHTTWAAAFDAKNRYGLPDKIPFCWEDFEAAITQGKSTEEYLEAIATLLPQADQGLQDKVKAAVDKAAGDAETLAKIYDRLASKVQLSSLSQ